MRQLSYLVLWLSSLLLSLKLNTLAFSWQDLSLFCLSWGHILFKVLIEWEWRISLRKCRVFGAMTRKKMISITLMTLIMMPFQHLKLSSSLLLYDKIVVLIFNQRIVAIYTLFKFFNFSKYFILLNLLSCCKAIPCATTVSVVDSEIKKCIDVALMYDFCLWIDHHDDTFGVAF